MQTRRFSSNDDENVEPANNDTAAAEKKRLLREIQELKCIAKQCEWSLQTLHFKDLEERMTERLSRLPEVPSHFGRTQNVQVELQNDLYRFAGFSCIKFRRDEFVFNFTSTNEEQKGNTYAVQIFVKDKKAKLGKWVMPMSIDMNYLLSETPIDVLQNLTAFIKSCKHNVDCYTVRQEQFLSLKKRISCMKHCTLQSDIGFRQINLELCGVHDSENDRYINLVIYLLYHSDKARPHKIEFDTTNKSKLGDGIKQGLKACLKEFKKSDLQAAFDMILAEDNSTFTWKWADDSDSPLELNNLSNSDEEDFLIQLQSNRRRSLRKQQKKRELRKKWNERKRQRNTKNSESSEDDQEDGHSKAKVLRAESLRRIPAREKKAGKAASKQEKIDKDLLEETTPLHKPKVKLKRTKLNFQTCEITNSNTNEMSLFESKFRNRSNGKQLEIAKLITSTPLRHTVDRKVPTFTPSLEKNDITYMETTKNTANKIDDFKNSDQLGKKRLRKRRFKKTLIDYCGVTRSPLDCYDF